MSIEPGGNARYSGQSGPLFNLVFITSLLTMLTVGIYRFWAKTRLRKYIWSSVSVDGDRFEYTGTGLEKLLGFLIAIAFLAVYLGVIQVVLTFLGIGLLSRNHTEITIIISVYLSLFAVLPFILFAVYRARRYRLARTRFRGIRFGMENAAWGYVPRAIGHSILTGLTLGILLPRQTFYLEKYMTDRSFYGDARFEQTGRWQDLYGAMKHIFIGLGLMVAGAAIAGLVNDVLGGILIVTGYFWFFIGFLYYRVHSFAYLTNHKTLNGTVTFQAAPRTGKVIKIFVLGGLAIGLAGAVMAGIFGGMMYGMAISGNLAQVPVLTVVVMSVIYLAAFLVLGALATVMILQPVIAHLINTLRVNNIASLAGVRQREADKGADAEGFADALDIGGAI